MYLNNTKCYSLLLGCCLSLSLNAKDIKDELASKGLRKPLCFVENKGQLSDQNYHPRNDIQYTLSTPGMSLFIGNGQMHYQFKKAEGQALENSKVATYRMDISLVGADPHAQVIAEDGQAFYENYFHSNSNVAITAHSWNKITYKNVYPNIDWVLYVKNDHVEYDFNVRPGGKVSDIKLAYDGASSLKMAKDGSITAETPMGNVSEKKPYAYDQSGKEVASGFRLKGNVLSFETSDYKGTLTIDPTLQWSTYFGGTNMDQVNGVTIDATTHNIYVCGSTSSAGIATAGTLHTIYLGGASDAFVARYNVGGGLQFVTYYGDVLNDVATCVATDNAGFIYVGGYTTSTANIASPGAYHGANNGATDGFLIRINAIGNVRTWGTYYGGTGIDKINGIATDGTSVYVTGQTASAGFVSSAGAYQAALSGPSDAFVAKFSAASGLNTWSTYYGGSAQENGMGVAFDPAGNVYVTGQTNSIINMASASAYQSTLNGTDNAFIAKFNSAGVRVWGTYFGGNGIDIANGIAYDNASGNIAITGNTTSTTGISTPNTFQTAFGGGIQDAFVSYFSSAGNLKWSSYYGGPSFDYGQAICFDANSNVVITGATFSGSGIATMNSLQAAIGGDHDAYLAKINPLGQTIWNTYFGGTFYDYANSVAFDAGTNQIAIAGFTSSLGNYGSGGISTVGSWQAANAGGPNDGFVTMFNADLYVEINQPYTDTILCAGNSFNLSYSVYNTGLTFGVGNTFTAQLSNAAGSFAVPVNIGSVTTGTSGIINCNIPALTALGTGYRIRIVASNPAFISPDDDINISIITSLTDGTATSNSPTCVGSDIDLFDTPPYTVLTYTWSGPLGFNSTLQNPVIPSVTTANAGTYTVTNTHNGCPPVTSTVAVVVNTVIPTTPTTGGSITACAGGTISLTANPGAFTGVTWYWVGPAGFTSTLQNPTISPATVSYTGKYYVEDSLNGCPSAPDSVLVTLNPVLPVSVTITADGAYIPYRPGDTICGGTMVNFTAFPTNGGATPSYQWMTAAGSPVIGATAGNWSSSSLTDGETVFCELFSNVDCPSPATAVSNIIKMNVITNPPQVYIAASPGIHVTPGHSITFTSTVYDGGLAPGYQWTSNGVAIPGATNTTYTLASVTKADTIGLTVTSTMLCAVPGIGTSNSLIANTNVGVANISASFENVELFPNPNNGKFTVKGTTDNLNSSMITFEVSNLLGQVIYRSQAELQNNEINKTIELGDIPSGIYFLHVGQDGAGKVFRFSMQH